jgi:hypothetical protein
VINDEHPKLGRLSEEIRSETSRFLRQGRRMKKLSIAQAAGQLQISPFLLKALEDGTANQPMNLVCRILEHYGFDEMNFFELFQDLMFEKARRERNRKERAHLSVSGDDPKPWERFTESLSAIRNRGWIEKKQ